MDKLIKSWKQMLITLGFTLVKEVEQFKHAQRMEDNPLLISCIKDKKIHAILENVGISIDLSSSDHRKSYFDGVKPRKFIESLIDKNATCGNLYNSSLFEELANAFSLEFTQGVELSFKWYERQDIPTIYNIPTQSQAKDRIEIAKSVSSIDKKTTELLNQRRSFISRNNSCMQGKPINYFDVYKNTKELKLCTFEDNNGNIYARALLWFADGKYYLDRLYTADVFNGSKRMQSFYQYKLYKKVLFELNIKKINCYSLDVICDHLTDVQKDARMCPPSPFAPLLVEGFDVSGCEFFPYADTFKGICSDKWYKDADDCEVGLENTDGSNSNCTKVECENCRERINEEEDARWSDTDEEYYCDDCCVYCEDHDTYINIDDAVENYESGHYHRRQDLNI